MIDVNVSFGQWPFQPNRIETVDHLASLLRREGIEQALVSHLGGVFAPDPHEFNTEIATALRRRSTLHAVPIVNPRIVGWWRDLESLPGPAPVTIRLLPTFHGYTLRSRTAREVADFARDANLPICVQLRLDDERSRYFGLKLRAINIDDVISLADRRSDTSFVILNTYMDEARRLLAETSDVHVDTSFAEWLYSVDRLTDGLDASRVLFGSHTPLLETRASVMKVFDGHQGVSLRKRIGVTNARRVFGL